MEEFTVIGEITDIEPLAQGLGVRDRARLNRMTTSIHSSPEFVVCVDNSEYSVSLELHKIYRTLPDGDAEADGDIRVVDESGEDYLYSKDRFVPIRVPAVVRESFVHTHAVAH